MQMRLFLLLQVRIVSVMLKIVKMDGFYWYLRNMREAKTLFMKFNFTNHAYLKI